MSTPPASAAVVFDDDTKAELSSLARVSHRLAMSDDSKLSVVCVKLLPMLLNKLGNAAAAQQGKVQARYVRYVVLCSVM